MNGPRAEVQTADAILMVRPARFGANPETADSNRFQQSGASPGEAAEALREFDGLVGRLVDAGVEVIVAEDTPSPPKPDACFPNNWVSFHADGTIVLYPMQPATRRPERREAIVEQACRELGFEPRRITDERDVDARIRAHCDALGAGDRLREPACERRDLVERKALAGDRGRTVGRVEQ
jgi:hypothetical protein